MHDSIDLNCDVGEVSFELDSQILPLVSSCNVSCGSHAGDTDLIAKTLAEAIRLGVAVGAHPSYPDRENFGRVSMPLAPQELVAELREQIGLVRSMAESLGGELHHVKPHGALYHDMQTNEPLAVAVVDLVRELNPELAFYGQADSPLAGICTAAGVRFVHEAFGDRRYADATTLRPRTGPDAVVDNQDDFLQHLSRLHHGHVIDHAGREHPLTVQTICLHSDTPHAATFAQAANRYFEENDVRIAAP